MSSRFRHGRNLHQRCFYSVCVLLEYEIPANPLFDVLIEYILAESESDTDSDSDSSVLSFDSRIDDDGLSIASSVADDE